MSEIGELAQLGEALEIIVGADNGAAVCLAFAPPSADSFPATHRIELPRAPLLWSPSWRALVVFIAGERLAGREPVDRDSPAAEARAEFWDAEPRSAYLLLPPALGPGPWRRLGVGLRTDYRSGKWGRREEYKHPHPSAPSVFLRGCFRAGVVAVWGGTLDVTPAGIVG